MVAITMEDRPRYATTKSTGFVLVSTYSWLCVIIVVAAVRYGQGLLVHKTYFGSDDGTALVGTVIYIATTVSWQYAVNGGLGRDMSSLKAEGLVLFFKSMYAAAALSIGAMAFAKLSSAFLIERVAPQTYKAKIVLFGMIAFWSVFSFFAVSFQCGIPRWTANTVQCHHGDILISVIVLNMVTDLVIAVWLMPILWTLSLDKEKRMTAIMLFGSRAVVPFAAGGQIWAVIKAGKSSNPTRDAVELTILTQLVSSLSLIAASIPRIKRFLGVGGSGMVYPEIHATELSTSRNYSRGDSRNTMPKLVPSGSTNFTATVSSKGIQNKKKARTAPHWQGLVSMGTQQDEHTSTSSLFDRDEYEGVMMQREVRVSVEQNDKDAKP